VIFHKGRRARLFLGGLRLWRYVGWRFLCRRAGGGDAALSCSAVVLGFSPQPTSMKAAAPRATSSPRFLRNRRPSSYPFIFATRQLNFDLLLLRFHGQDAEAADLTGAGGFRVGGGAAPPFHLFESRAVSEVRSAAPPDA